MNVKELRNKSVAELMNEKIALQKELFNMRMQRGTGEFRQTHLFRKVKKEIARLMMLIHEKEG